MSKRIDRQKMRERMRKRADERRSSGGTYHIQLPDGVEFMSLDEGRNFLDFLPYEVTGKYHPDEIPAGELWVRRPYRMHRNIGPENRRIICLTSFGKSCPVCEERAKLTAEGADKSILGALRPQERELYVVADKGSAKVLDTSYYNFGAKLDEEVSYRDDDTALFWDLEEGFTVEIRMSEEKFAGKTYLEATRVDFEERKDLSDKFSESEIKLDDCLVELTAEQVQALLHGMDTPPPFEMDEEDDDSESRSRSRERDDEDEEQEEEPRTTRRRRRR